MVTDLKQPPATTAASLVSDILGDLQLLVDQQFQLTRCEIEQELRQRANAASMLGAGLAGYFLSAIMFSLAAAHLLHWTLLPTESSMEKFPLWVCESVIAVLLCGVGSLLVSLGRRRFRAVTLSQNPAREIFEDAKQWKIAR